MIKIIDKCDTGKTRKLMEIVKQNNGILVCRDPYRYESKAFNYGIGAIRCMSYGEFIDKIRVNDYDATETFYIDELEAFLSIMCPRIEGFDLTTDI